MVEASIYQLPIVDLTMRYTVKIPGFEPKVVTISHAQMILATSPKLSDLISTEVRKAFDIKDDIEIQLVDGLSGIRL